MNEIFVAENTKSRARRIVKKIIFLLGVSVLSLPATGLAWWNSAWTQRVKITLNTTASGADTKEALTAVPVLVRLHTGNFSFADAKEDGSDLRFVAGDDKTPLKYHLERFDPVNELALVWVQVPLLPGGSGNGVIWAYYGNGDVTGAEDAKGTYDADFSAVYHFSGDGAPKDSTGNANNAVQSSATRSDAAQIGDGIAFDGGQSVRIPATPSLKLAAPSGFTFSAWVYLADAQDGSVLFAQQEGAKSILIGLKQSGVFARIAAGGGAPIETAPTPALAKDTWHHVAVTISNRVLVYVDGKELASANAASPELAGDITLGAPGFKGRMDEVELSRVARSPDWIKVAYASQSAEDKLLAYAQEGGESGSGSYFRILLGAVTLDGWVVIVILMAMMAISFTVMALKAVFVGRTDRANEKFLAEFRARSGDLVALGGVIAAKAGEEAGGLADSSLYRLYQLGLAELKLRFERQQRRGGEQPNLSPQSIEAIRASIDAGLVKENHRLNQRMVLLTIAISGGPFLGLLGTVVGVMITFAAIAAVGDVNVNSIAPGIAAALVATVAGLGVAIPSLFGYNYLASRIRNITADMQVFADEFITKLAEQYSS
jgi:biopolymer transport protein ExbB